jgi:DNA-binding CsgD family transcriptional regulator
MSSAFPFPVLSINLEQMAMVIDTLPFATHMRVLASNQYVLANLQHAQQLGFQRTEEVVHISYPYIARHRRECIAELGGSLELEDAYQRFIHQANAQTELAKEPRRFQVCTLFPTGFIYIGIVQKIPILSAKQHVNAILTFSQDITTRFDLADIYLLYKRNYTEGKRAIQQFMKYLGIGDLFRIFPTHRELLTLLMFRKDARAKYVARQLGLSDRTVEEYKARLRNKLKTHISLEQLLLKLRNPFNKLDETVPFMPEQGQ